MIGSAMRRPLVVFKDELEDPPGTWWGPVWIFYFGDDPNEPEREEKLDQWMKRSDVRKLAEERGYEFQEQGA